jgi:sulfur-oxidizing protein SoxX
LIIWILSSLEAKMLFRLFLLWKAHVAAHQAPYNRGAMDFVRTGLLVACAALHPPLAAQNAALPGDAQRGRAVVLSRMPGNCLLCHAIPGADREPGTLGPSLAGIGARLSASELRLRLADSSRLNPQTVMPPYSRTENLHDVAEAYRGRPLLDAQQIEDAVAYLLTLK